MLAVTQVYAQNLTLLSVTPGSGGVNSVIEVTAVGFQQGVAAPPMTVTLTPQVGPSTLIPATVQGNGSGRSITFTLPAGVAPGAYAVSVSGGTFVSSNTLPLNVVVPAFSLSPATGGRGSTVIVDITGSIQHLLILHLRDSGRNPGGRRGGRHVRASTDDLARLCVRATLTIAAGATLGGRNVQVLSLDNIIQANAFTVTAPLPLTF